MSSSNWHNGWNWAPAAFEMDGTDCIIFPKEVGADPTNVNDIVYNPPTNTTPFMLAGLSIEQGSYELSGNPVSVTTVTASYRAGSNSVIKFDLHSRTGAVTAPPYVPVPIETNPARCEHEES